MVENSINTLRRDEKGRFLKGHRMGGRRPMPSEVKELFVGATVDAANYLISVVQDPTEKSDVRVKCAEIILNRAYGMPRQSLDTDINVTTPSIDLSHLSVDDLLKIANMKVDDVIEVENITIGADT